MKRYHVSVEKPQPLTAEKVTQALEASSDPSSEIISNTFNDKRCDLNRQQFLPRRLIHTAEVKDTRRKLAAAMTTQTSTRTLGLKNRNKAERRYKSLCIRAKTETIVGVSGNNYQIK